MATSTTGTTTAGINLNNISVDPTTGRVSLSGAQSGVDYQSIINSIIAARHIPIDTIQTDVTDNQAKVSAFNDLNTMLTSLQSSLSNLYGAVSFQNANNDFATKQVFASTARADGQTPPDAATLIGVSADNSATVEQHSIEILSTAKSEKISSSNFSSATTALSTLTGLTDGSFQINGTTINVFATDTLQDVRDRIKAADQGANATGVTASIVSVTSTQNVLVLTSDKTGVANTINLSNETGGALSSLGISSDGGATFTNELQVAQDARLKVDGLKDPTHYESNSLVSQTTTLSHYLNTAPSTGSFNLTVGGNTQTINYDASTDTLQTLANKINTAFGTNVASITGDASGYRLEIDGSGSTVTTNDTNGLLGDLGVDNLQVVTRPTNSITDLIPGLNISLYNAQEGTTVNLSVEQNLSGLTTDIQSFVTAYNNVRQFINKQNTTDPNTGLQDSTSSGPLFDSPVLSQVQTMLSTIIGSGVAGVDVAASTLAQIGINFVDNTTVTDPSMKDTLTVDTTALGNALTANPQGVQNLLAFGFSSSDARLSLSNFTGDTTYSPNGYAVNIAYAKSYNSDTFTPTTTFTPAYAVTGAPASNGISNVDFGSSVASGDAFRYSYSSSGEDLTLSDVTTGVSQTVNITAALDAAAGTGSDLGTGQTADISFSNFGATVTLSGDDGFQRGTSFGPAALDTSGLDTNTTATNATATLATSGIDKATVDALAASGAYDAATGKLTLGVTSSGSGEVHFDTAAGLKFAVDGGTVSSDVSATNLDDGAAHSVGVYVNNGTSDVLVGMVGFASLAASASGTGSITMDVGTGLLGETSVTQDGSTPMSDFLSGVSNGSFEIHDGSGALLGSVSYNATDSLDTLASNVSAIAGVTGKVVATPTGLAIDITSDTNDALSFQNDTGGLISALNVTNKGNSIYSANLGGSSTGADDGSATVSGNIVTATSQTGANGLAIYYNGNGDLSGASINYTVGLGAQLNFAVQKLLELEGHYRLGNRRSQREEHVRQPAHHRDAEPPRYRAADADRKVHPHGNEPRDRPGGHAADSGEHGLALWQLEQQPRLARRNPPTSPRRVRVSPSPSVYNTQRVMTATPAQLVAMLYEQAIMSLKTAVRAIEAGEIETRFKANKQASDIIVHLCNTLDIERGGEIADRLSKLYRYMLGRLTFVDVRNDPAPVREVIALLEPLYEFLGRLGAQSQSRGRPCAQARGARARRVRRPLHLRLIPT